MQWPEDTELSRIYREIPDVTPSTSLKARVMTVAEEHAAQIRNTRSASHSMQHLWYVPVGLAALVMLAILLPIQKTPEPVIVAQKPAVASETPKPAMAPKIIMAQAEPGISKSFKIDLSAASSPPPPAGDTAARMQVGDAKAEKTPDQQLTEIRTLMNQGHLSEAKEQLRQFRKEHPDYALPDDLKIPALRSP